MAITRDSGSDTNLYSITDTRIDHAVHLFPIPTLRSCDRASILSLDRYDRFRDLSKRRCIVHLLIVPRTTTETPRFEEVYRSHQLRLQIIRRKPMWSAKSFPPSAQSPILISIQVYNTGKLMYLSQSEARPYKIIIKSAILILSL